MITDTLATFLIANANITTDRVYPNQAPQTAELPVVVYYLDGILRIKTFDGTNATREARFQLEVYSKTLLESQTVGQQLVAELEDFNGTMGALYIYDCVIDDEDNGFENATELYFHSISITITYK